jgi:4-diphosphocytidyl-2-C-methyl-D-erythritol kinase
MDQITLRANAKLNLSLDITGRRADGYHLMDMIMQSVDLYDTVTLRRSGEISVSLQMENGAASLPPDEHNTAYKAAQLYFQQTGIRSGVSIALTKRIPQQAGMAGGSADAAAVLIGLDRMFETGLSTRQLLEIGVQVGADVPFCLIGGTARVSGIGEIVRPETPFTAGQYLIVKPPFGISTPESFHRFDSMADCRRPDNDALLAAMAGQDLGKMAQVSANVLEIAAASPEIERIKQRLYRSGADFALMTGSGSAVFGLFADAEKAAQAAKLLADCGRIYLCKAAAAGVME